MRERFQKYVSRRIRGYFRRRILSNHGLGIAVKAKNGLMVVDPHDFVVSRQLLKHGEFDWPEICWLQDLLDEDSRVAVVGAHIGSVLIPLAKKARHVIGFEPDSINFQLLQNNVSINNATNVALINQCVGHQKMTVHIAHNWSNSGDSTVCLSHSDGKDPEVEMTTLDEAVKDPVDLVVMDAQGCECHAIRGGHRTLSRVKYFYVEYAPAWLEDQGSSSEEFVSLLENVFEHMYIGGKTLVPFESRCWIDYLTRLTDKRKRVINLLFTNTLLTRNSLRRAG